MITKFEAVKQLVGGQLSTGPNDTFVYHDGQTPPSESAINAKLAELKAAYDAKAYARNREEEYPTIQELVVALYDTNDRTAVDAKRAAVKAKFPKP